MRSNHVSIATAIVTIIKIIIAGERPDRAIWTCLAMRKAVNEAYRNGMTPEELEEMLK